MVLNKTFLLSSVLKLYPAPLNKRYNLFILLLIQFLNAHKRPTNYISINLMMRLHSHTTNVRDINKVLSMLIDAGYIYKTKSQVKITPAGNQILEDMDRRLAQYSFKLRKADKQLIAVKRPKTL